VVHFIEFNNDQRRETVNSRQRFQAWQHAADRQSGYRGSMVWEQTKGQEYLFRAYYDHTGKRRQKSLGRRNAETEALKQKFESERADAAQRRKSLDRAIEQQAAVNRALGLGRVPLIAARILRLLDKRGLLGKGLRVAGTNALFCYEAACGVFVDSSIVTTGDIDLLFDARRRLRLIGDPDLTDANLIQILKLADRSFDRTAQSFRAENRDGYLVDLIKPMRNPPWRPEQSSLGDASDLQAAEIAGLAWLESAPAFEQIAIDEKGFPLRIVATDPRVFAVHKHWLSRQPGRDPVKRQRDAAQAQAVAELVKRYLLHLPFEMSELRMVPREVAEAAIHDFGGPRFGS
jgi:hypothetical protein